jgi:hypothetical protein
VGSHLNNGIVKCRDVTPLSPLGLLELGLEAQVKRRRKPKALKGRVTGPYFDSRQSLESAPDSLVTTLPGSSEGSRIDHFIPFGPMGIFL